MLSLPIASPALVTEISIFSSGSATSSFRAVKVNFADFDPPNAT